jgi:hypothetical protein
MSYSDTVGKYSSRMTSSTPFRDKIVSRLKSALPSDGILTTPTLPPRPQPPLLPTPGSGGRLRARPLQKLPPPNLLQHLPPPPSVEDLLLDTPPSTPPLPPLPPLPLHSLFAKHREDFQSEVTKNETESPFDLSDFPPFPPPLPPLPPSPPPPSPHFRQPPPPSPPAHFFPPSLAALPISPKQGLVLKNDYGVCNFTFDDQHLKISFFPKGASKKTILIPWQSSSE